MALIYPPTQAYHTPSGDYQDIPASESYSAYFYRYWGVLTLETGEFFRLERVRSLPEPAVDEYTIGIESPLLGAVYHATGGWGDERTQLSFYHGVRIALLEHAENGGVSNLLPLESSAEMQEYSDWLAIQIGE